MSPAKLLLVLLLIGGGGTASAVLIANAVDQRELPRATPPAPTPGTGRASKEPRRVSAPQVEPVGSSLHEKVRNRRHGGP